MAGIVIAGNTSGTVTINAPAAAGSSVLTLPVAIDTLVGKNTTDVLTNKTLTAPVVDSLNGGQLAGFRNKIINGNMDIAQRGTAAVTTTGVYGPADRYTSYNGGDTFSTTIAEFVSGDTLYDTGGARYYTSIAVTSVAGAGNYIIFLQTIENVRLLAGQTVTVSFWAKAASGTPLIGLEIVQVFGSGGSPSAPVTGIGQSVTLSTTWTKYIKTFTLDSLNGKTIGTDVNSSHTDLNFWLDSGATYNTRSGSIGQASKTVSIAQVQLEIGTVATPFEQRPIVLELALCQRYLPCFVSNGSTNTPLSVGQAYLTTAAQAVIPFPVQARVPSTGCVVSNQAHFACQNATGSPIANTGITWSSSSPTCATVNVTGSSGLVGGNAANIFIVNAVGYIYFTGCEL